MSNNGREKQNPCNKDYETLYSPLYNLLKVPKTRNLFCIFWLIAVFKIRNNRP